MNAIERVISVISPAWALSRSSARATLNQIEAFAGSQGGYEAGKLNRNTKGRLGSAIKEHAIPVAQLDRLRWQSWNLWRNNSYARKIVRSLESKVVGQGMQPESQAINDDGTPNVEFRAKAKALWMSIQSGFDYRGMPGRGGVTFGGLQRLALRACILSGETLHRIVPISQADQFQRDIPVPLTLQMIDAARLSDQTHPQYGEQLKNGNTVYRGIEIDTEGKRIAYYIGQYSIGMNEQTWGSLVRIPSEQIAHLFIEDDIDQMRGVPWFAAALLNMRDTDDLQYNVLKASAMSACVVMGYRRPTGASRFGLAQSGVADVTTSDGTDLTDADGNQITKLEPGMFVDLGRDGSLEGFSPNQPNTNAEAFIQHMLRGTAAGFSGVKSSTVTGDYRGSSFSSERSADNDTWPEIQALQEWFATSFCQPTYESVVRGGVLAGYFDGIVSPEEFSASPGRYTQAKWQGPIQLSINPVDDINAASMRMHYGLSSPQMEAARQAVNWRDVIADVAEFRGAVEAAGLPPEYANSVMDVNSQDIIAQTMAATAQQDLAAKSLRGRASEAITAPDYVSSAAARGLEWNADGKSGDGVTDKTIREARDMANGSISEDKVRRMGPWFERHQSDMSAPKNDPSNEDFPGAGAVAWALWGGPTSGDIMRAAKWAQGEVGRLDRLAAKQES